MPQETDDGGIEFFNTIVLQPHLKLVTDLGRGYHVRCRYKSREAAAHDKTMLSINSEKRKEGVPERFTSDEGVGSRRDGKSLDLSSENESNAIPMPACHMKIFSGDIIAENVKIGDPLKIVINIDKQTAFGLHVTDCLVRDGLGWGEQKLINGNGCPLDGEIMGQFDYTDDNTKATVSFPAHKFPYTSSVYYQCNVKLCSTDNPECRKVPACSSKRPKRDTETDKVDDEDGHPATIEVYSGLYVNENAEVIEGSDDAVLREKTPDDAICVSQRNFAIAIAIAGLILMLAVIAAVLIIMTRRRGKTISNSGSSIYSGPYTNTAFSHSS
jgi:hypothetical protein